MSTWREALSDDSGQDLVEYAMLASFLSIVAVTVLYQISPLVRGIFRHIHTALRSLTSAQL